MADYTWIIFNADVHFSPHAVSDSELEPRPAKSVKISADELVIPDLRSVDFL